MPNDAVAGSARRDEEIERLMPALGPLLNYARARLAARVALGDLPHGEVQAEEVVDEALAEAICRRDAALRERPYPWLRRLVREAVQRQVELHRGWRRKRSIDEPVGIHDPDPERAGSYRRLVELVPDPGAPIPEAVPRASSSRPPCSTSWSRCPNRGARR